MWWCCRLLSWVGQSQPPILSFTCPIPGYYTSNLKRLFQFMGQPNTGIKTSTHSANISECGYSPWTLLGTVEGVGVCKVNEPPSLSLNCLKSSGRDRSANQCGRCCERVKHRGLGQPVSTVSSPGLSIRIWNWILSPTSSVIFKTFLNLSFLMHRN